ncbi:zinc finger protein 28-like [Odontomachus brunneus]|uniref:zinc finger protein 28-like n=1 Tax=Odontomachus brunneus TaxID=486640 RepID=UPI0013F21608|nr:zinc finger protein 28-like [Odontomachus brunneus]XP_032668318.1 zinc finger protein 28-like [Odontomachus brunneus]XP_032668319.1 zinc finger protein 28-like [Odontomachus brunneus]
MGCTSDQDSENVSSNLQNEDDAKISVIQKRKKYKCNHPDCDAIFSEPSRLERHIRQHTGERPYICNASGCTKSYVSSCHLKRHLKTHDLIEIVYKCLQCSQMIVNACNLKRHYKEQHGKGKIICEECGTVFNKKFDLAKHCNIVHFKSTIHKCDKCPKSFGNINKLKRHKKNHEKTYPCQISGCSEVFCKWYLLRKHQTEHKNSVLEHKCDKCNKVLRTKTQLKLHSKIHSEDRMVIPCPYDKCHKAYYYKSNLEQHIKIKHLGKKFYCDICSAGLTSKQKLIKHIERQTLCNKNIMTLGLSLALRKITPTKYNEKKE